jgi:cytochrome b561
MQWKSSTNRYGGVAIFLHWSTALGIAGLLLSGFRAAGMHDDAGKIALLRVHAVIGMSVVLLTLARLLWWWFADRKPDDAVPHWQKLAASLVHRLFYCVIIVMGASGAGMLVASGAGKILFAGAPGPLPDFLHFAPRIPHGIGARVLLALIAAHVAAALFHHFVRRDRLLARMGLG